MMTSLHKVWKMTTVMGVYLPFLIQHHFTCCHSSAMGDEDMDNPPAFAGPITGPYMHADFSHVQLD